MVVTLHRTKLLNLQHLNKKRKMEFQQTSIPGVVVIRPKVFEDSRGYFSETWREDLFVQNIGNVHFVQDNESMSSRNVLRGLHYQKGTASQAKLVRVTRGCVLDVAVDLRRSSPTFGRWVAEELSAENHRQLFIPKGFAHGFAVLSDTAQFQYKVDAPYCPQAEVTLLWNDPDIAVQWPSGLSPELSARDTKGLSLEQLMLEGLLFP